VSKTNLLSEIIEIIGNKRKPKESFEAYKKRRRIENRVTRLYIKHGHTLWHSSEQGQYIKSYKV